MDKPITDLYDVFISHSPADQKWVDEWLLLRLEQAGLRVAVPYREFIIGAFKLENIQRFVKDSRHIIVVLTPAWLASEWNEVEGWLGRTLDPAARRRKLLPLLLQPCDLPELIADLHLEYADFTDPDRREQEFKRLLRTIYAKMPPRPRTEVPELTWQQWWRWWLRYHQRQLRLMVIASLLLWLAVGLVFKVFPFQDRLVWVAEPYEFPGAWVIHNTGATLVLGGWNEKEGCVHSSKGLWQRPLSPGSEWIRSEITSDVDLCIADWSPPSLSNINDLASLPSEPQTVYALTSHSGILVSTDGGAHFAPAAGPPPLENDNLANVLGVMQGDPPIFWVAGFTGGLWRYQGGAWVRMDGLGKDGCAGLLPMTVKALLVTEGTIVIGSDQQGLWVSDNGGVTCRAVFDAGRRSRYEFRGLAAVGSATPGRYLAVVRDGMTNAAAWRLLDLCARPGACTTDLWQAEPPLWTGSYTVDQVIVQADGQGGWQWYLATEIFGQVWHGDLSGDGKSTALPWITHCLGCRVGLAPSLTGATPYLLAKDYVYTYTTGDWWRQFWP